MKTRMFKKVAIIQLGSLQQTLFTVPTILALRTKFPDAKITVLGNSNHASIFEGWDAIDNLIPIDHTEMMELANQNTKMTVAEIFAAIGVKSNQNYDTVINLGFNETESLLATYLDGAEIRGPFIRHDGEVEIRDQWSQYFAAVVDKTILNPFHIVDLYRYIADVPIEDAPFEMIVPKKIINDIAPLIANSDGLKIGIELSKDWPAAQYVALIEEMLISRPKTTFYLIGTLNDRIIARKIIDSIADIEIRRRCIDLSGRANMRELLALCHEFHLVVGVGGIATHFAAISNTFTITLTQLNQQFFQSGPYGHGHIAVANENPEKKIASIGWQVVANIIENALNEHGTQPPTLEQWKKVLKGDELLRTEQIKILSSQRTIFEQDTGTRIDLIYEAVSESDTNLQECLLSFYRLIWQLELNHSHDLLTSIELKRQESLDGMTRLVDVLERVHKLASFGISYSRYAKADLQQNNLELAKQDSNRLQDIDNILASTAKNFPAVAPICNFYHVHQFQIREENPELTAALTQISYERIQIQVSAILELISSLIISKKKEKEKRLSPEQPANADV